MVHTFRDGGQQMRSGTSNGRGGKVLGCPVYGDRVIGSSTDRQGPVIDQVNLTGNRRGIR